MIKMILAREMGATNLQVTYDSQLFTRQTIIKYQTYEAQLVKYLLKVQELKKKQFF